jgi:hypothetical protein
LIDWLYEFASAGEKRDLKRLGSWLESYPHKKQHQLFIVTSLVGEQEQGAMETDDDGDDMDLELE